MGVSESIYKGISPEAFDASLQWEECKRRGSDLAHSSSSQQLTSLKNFTSIASAVYRLFIYVGWGANVLYVQRCWISVTGKIKDRQPQKWSRQSGPTAGSWGEHPSLPGFIMITVKPHSKLKRERERERKAKTGIPSTRERDKTCAAASSPSLMELIMNVWWGLGNNG